MASSITHHHKMSSAAVAGPAIWLAPLVSHQPTSPNLSPFQASLGTACHHSVAADVLGHGLLSAPLDRISTDWFARDSKASCTPLLLTLCNYTLPPATLVGSRISSRHEHLSMTPFQTSTVWHKSTSSHTCPWLSLCRGCSSALVSAPRCLWRLA